MLNRALKRSKPQLVRNALGRRAQRGIMILETMVSIVIVLLGIVGVAGLVARSTTLTGQAQYRTEAGMFAEQIVQMISLSVDRTSSETLASSLESFKHNEGGTTQCSFTGNAVSESSTLGQILKGARGGLTTVAGLPGAKTEGQQVKVETANNLNRVTVTLCWKGPSDQADRNYQIQAFVH
jgi:Tfp pilus assembly protein PilV